MMAFRLFSPAPRDLLLLGLDGGSLAKFCYCHLRQSRIRVVEIEPDVIALCRRFLVPEDGERFEVFNADGVDYVSECPAPVDVLIIDAFDRVGIAPSLSSYQRTRRCLASAGVLVINLAGEQSEWQAYVARIRDAFRGSVSRVGLGAGVNCVVFAFKDATFQPDWGRIAGRARALKAELGLDFPRFARRIEGIWQGLRSGDGGLRCEGPSRRRRPARLPPGA